MKVLTHPQLNKLTILGNLSSRSAPHSPSLTHILGSTINKFDHYPTTGRRSEGMDSGPSLLPDFDLSDVKPEILELIKEEQRVRDFKNFKKLSQNVKSISIPGKDN